MTGFLIEDVGIFSMVTQIPVSRNCHTITHLFTFLNDSLWRKIVCDTASLIPVFTATTINHVPTL